MTRTPPMIGDLSWTRFREDFDNLRTGQVMTITGVCMITRIERRMDDLRVTQTLRSRPEQIVYEKRIPAPATLRISSTTTWIVGCDGAYFGFGTDATRSITVEAAS